jgi:hypothetical protein
MVVIGVMCVFPYCFDVLAFTNWFSQRSPERDTIRDVARSMNWSVSERNGN